MKIINRHIKKKWLYTILLLLLLVIASVSAIYALTYIRSKNNLDLTIPYLVEEDLYGTHGAEIQMQKVDSFASGLCVSERNISMDGVAIGKQTKGALFDLEHQEILFAQKLHEKSYPASITKIMTAILALKYGNLEDTITISESMINLEEGSTEIGLAVGDQVTLDELLHGLLIYSGNDAAMAIAEYIGNGDCSKFVEMMNAEARRIGATNTHFMNPSGLHDENHYTTVYDIYLMMQEAMSYPHFIELSQLSVYNMTFSRGEEQIVKRLDSTDQYITRQVSLPKNVTILGGKTGTTSDAGSCLVLLTQNAYGEPFISVILHAPTKSSLYQNMDELLEQINR